MFGRPTVERISTPICAKPFANETTPVLSDTLTIALLILPIAPPLSKFGIRSADFGIPFTPPSSLRGEGKGEGQYSAFSNPQSALD